MVDEHFGINIVEFMVRAFVLNGSQIIFECAFQAAGVIPVTHASGGPLHDIVKPVNDLPTGPSFATVTRFVSTPNTHVDVGFHATSPDTFADAFNEVLSLSAEDDFALRLRARTRAVQRFSEEEFEKGWTESGWKDWLPRA